MLVHHNSQENVILSDVLGSIGHGTTFLGLVNCFTHIEFDQDLDTLIRNGSHLFLGFSS